MTTLIFFYLEKTSSKKVKLTVENEVKEKAKFHLIHPLLKPTGLIFPLPQRNVGFRTTLKDIYSQIHLTKQVALVSDQLGGKFTTLRSFHDTVSALSSVGDFNVSTVHLPWLECAAYFSTFCI